MTVFPLFSVSFTWTHFVGDVNHYRNPQSKAGNGMWIFYHIFLHDHRCLSKAIFVIDTLKSTSVASVLAVFAEGPVENFHFPLTWQS